MNGDGIDDVVVAAPSADSDGRLNVGTTYVVFGAVTGFSPILELSTLDETTGLVINGVDEDDSSGESVAPAGDVNSDGRADLIIGASSADSGGALTSVSKTGRRSTVSPTSCMGSTSAFRRSWTSRPSAARRVLF